MILILKIVAATSIGLVICFLLTGKQNEKNLLLFIKTFLIWHVSIMIIAMEVTVLLMLLMFTIAAISNFQLSQESWVYPLKLTMIISPILALIPARKYYRKKLIIIKSK